jgi:hypothetical protein
MAEFFPIDIGGTGNYYGNFTGAGNFFTGSFTGSFSGDGSGLTGVSTTTGSFLVTASFAANSSNTNISFTKGDGDKFNVNLSKLVDGGTF